MERLRIAVIRGDGIGPELVDAALRVLEAVGETDGLEFARYTPTADGERRVPSDRFTREPAPATDRAALRR